MRNYCYIVYFTSGPSVKVYAGCESQAFILAQAERIKGGYDYLNVSCANIVE